MSTRTSLQSFARSAVAACALLAASASQAGFVGNTVHADFRYPTVGAGFYDYGNAVVGAGVEFAAAANTNYLFFDLTDTTITIGASPGTVGFASGAFNGFGFDDVLSAIDDIVSVSIDATTSLSGFGASRLGFTADQILINLESLYFQQGERLVLNVAFRNTSVPEPASLALVGLALAAASGAARRKRAN